MKLTSQLVTANAEQYREHEAFYAVEREQLETLPRAFEAGKFGRRDAEWVVRWYYRRFLGAYPDAERRAVEERFCRNDFETVRSAIADATTATEVGEALESLTELDGVDVPVASAFLFFLAPEEYVVVGEREWAILHAAGELYDPYPAPPSVEAYERYLGTCRALTRRLDCRMWDLYRALWRLWKERNG